VEKILAAGCNNYIAKPMDPEELKAMYHKYICTISDCLIFI
jgi:CheY-like chemotaxis protein